jgi:hypothetical protein
VQFPLGRAFSDQDLFFKERGAMEEEAESESVHKKESAASAPIPGTRVTKRFFLLFYFIDINI